MLQELLNAHNLVDTRHLKPSDLAGTGLDSSSFPLPREVFTAMDEVEPGVVIAHLPELSPMWINYLANVVGPGNGADEITWPSPKNKVDHLAAIANPTVYPDRPDYAHSCFDLDKRLMDAVPQTMFFDVSRGGIANFLPKGMGYTQYAFNKHDKQDRAGTLDRKTKQYYQEFGQISTVPITSADQVLMWAQNAELAMHLVTGSSVAEAFTALCRKLRHPQLMKEISQLKGGSWTSQLDRRGTSQLRDTLWGQLATKYHDELLKFISETTIVDNESPYPATSLLAKLVMQIVDETMKIPKNSTTLSEYWQTNIYQSMPNRSIHDVSELVASRRTTQKPDTPLPPPPWASFLLFPHGTKNKPQATKGQMIKAARISRQYYPEATVFIISDKRGNPLPYNRHHEHRATHDLTRNPSPVNAEIATIVQAVINYIGAKPRQIDLVERSTVKSYQ